MANQFSPSVSKILSFSREEAMRLASPSVGPEHLLIALLRERDGLVNDLFEYNKINKQAVKYSLEEKVRNDNILNASNNEIVLNAQANNILKLAVLEARLQQTDIIDTQHILLAILHDRTDNGAKIILNENSMNYEDTLLYIKKQLSSPKGGVDIPEDDETYDNAKADNSKHNNTTSTASKQRTSSATPVLDKFSTDLTKAASEGALDPIVGREKEMIRVMEILCRRKKNNPILIGEPGVGKSAIVEGLAQLIVAHKTSPILFNKRVVNLDMTSIVAGTKYRGQFEERIKALINEIEQHPELIVFIDEIHTIIGAGSAAGTMDAANILKPALARGVIQCIGATTLDEYRNSIEKDGALERRFQKIIVNPSSKDETLKILQNIKDRYEKYHHVSYTDDAIKACVELTERYVSDRAFPDKAIDALDEAGAHIHLKHANIPPEITEMEEKIEETKRLKQEAVKNQNFELAAQYRDQQLRLANQLEELNSAWMDGNNETKEKVNDADIANVVSIMTGVPVQRIATEENERLRIMGDELKKSVVAQDNAINKIVRAIQRNRLGLRNPNHPVGVFLFLGPTGVGKTYLAKKLAEHMFGSETDLIRIDMSEYSESFNVSRLVGAPPGYVGYEEGGQLTEKVRRKPYSIVLLDEIEKANAAVFNMLLQVLDDGRLTDGNGRLIDFRNTIVIMTSNTGTRQLKEFGRGIGFGVQRNINGPLTKEDKEYAQSVIQKSLSKQFAPEFLNRLDDIIIFDQLDKSAIRLIVDIELKSVLRRISNIGYEVEISDAAKDYIASKGYDVQFGARPLKRALQQYIEDGICERILESKIKKGTCIHIDYNENSKSLDFS